MKYQIAQQSQDLLKDWDAEIVDMLNASYALSSERCTELAESFNGHLYSRIHRRSDGVTLLLEERVKGSMSPVCYLLKQDFSDLEKELEYKSKIVLSKGNYLPFLDYTIKNSLNNNGLVLSKKGRLYESHLGNYGDGTQENIDKCKKYAVLYFMIARPETFATCLTYKILRPGSGTYNEYFLLTNLLKKENIELPKEITCSDCGNSMILFNGQKLN